MCTNITKYLITGMEKRSTGYYVQMKDIKNIKNIKKVNIFQYKSYCEIERRGNEEET